MMRPADRVVFAGLFALCLAAPTRADEYAGFRIPDNGYRQWTMSFSSQGSSARSHEPGTARSSGGASGEVSTDLQLRRDSDRRFRDFLLSISANGERDHSRTEGMGSVYPSQYVGNGFGEYRRSSAGEVVDLASTERWFPSSPPLSVDLSLQVRLDDGQYQSREAAEVTRATPAPSRVGAWDSIRDRSYFPVASAALGLGWGRVRNATAVFEASVLEDRLRASGVLSHPLGPEARKRLVALMYARQDFPASMDRPAVSIWDSLERILREDGALSAEALPARSLLRLTEPFFGASHSLDRTGLPQSPIVRSTGWSVGVSVNEYESRRSWHHARAWSTQIDSAGLTLARTDYRYVEVSRQSTSETALSVHGEQHSPLGSRLQWDCGASCLFPIHHGPQGYRQRVFATLSWCVADRWLATASASHARDLSRDEMRVILRDERTSGFEGSLDYFVSEHVDARLRASLVWEKRPTGSLYPFNGLPVSFWYEARADYELSLTYRFSGYARIADVFPAGVAR